MLCGAEVDKESRCHSATHHSYTMGRCISSKQFSRLLRQRCSLRRHQRRVTFLCGLPIQGHSEKFLKELGGLNWNEGRCYLFPPQRFEVKKPNVTPGARIRTCSLLVRSSRLYRCATKAAVTCSPTVTVTCSPSLCQAICIDTCLFFKLSRPRIHRRWRL